MDGKALTAWSVSVRTSSPKIPSLRSRGGTTIRLLNYDGQGYWLAQKRLSKGRFIWWPESGDAAKQLEADEALLLFAAGDVGRVRAAPM